MKRTHCFALAVAAIIPLAALFFIAGCESATDYAIDVNPPFWEFSEGTKNPSVTLSAKGWSDYMWKLSDPDIGYLSSTHGESVIYTAVAFPESVKKQVVTVNARNVISGGGSSGSNSVSHAYTGEVIIRHLKR